MKAILVGNRSLLNQRIARLLERNGFEVTEAIIQDEVIELLAQEFFDLMLLVAPDEEGQAIEFVSRVRDMHPSMQYYVLARDGAVSQLIPRIQPLLSRKVAVSDFPVVLKEEMARVDLEREYFRLELLKYVEELVDSVQNASSAREAAKKVVERLQTLFSCRGSAVVLSIEVNKPPVAIATAGDCDKISELWKKPSGIYQWLSENQIPLLARRGHSSVPSIQRDLLKLGLGPCGFVPIFTTQAMVGALVIEREPTGEPFSDSVFCATRIAAKALALRLETDKAASSDDLRLLIQRERESRESLEDTLAQWHEMLRRLCREVANIIEIRKGRQPESVETLVKLVLALAAQLGLSTQYLEEAVCLRDIGMLAMAEDTLLEASQSSSMPEKMTKERVEIGFEILSRVRLPSVCLEVERHHHENYDGSGIPDGLRGEEIPSLARVVRMIEDYVDMTTFGDGGRPIPSPVTLAHISREAGKAYDPKIADAFVKIMQAQGVTPEQQTLSVIAHELRAPLTYLVGFSELLAARKDLPPQAKEMASQLHMQTEKMVTLTERLLDLSRLKSGRVALTWQLVNLNELIEQQVIESKALSERHTFRLERPSIPVSIRVDATRVSQAVSNLLSNAVKYSPKGGEIVVKLEESTKEVVINISDQGVGIPADKVERLSQPFYRVEEPETKQVEGLGLGLALVRSIVEAHGGKIWVKSEPGKGSTFSFSLPK